MDLPCLTAGLGLFLFYIFRSLLIFFANFKKLKPWPQT